MRFEVRTLGFDRGLAAQRVGLARAFLLLSRARGRALTAAEFGEARDRQIVDEASASYALQEIAAGRRATLFGPHQRVPWATLARALDGPGSFEDWEALAEDRHPCPTGHWTIEECPWSVVFKTLVSSDAGGGVASEAIPIGAHRTRYRYFVAPESPMDEVPGGLVIGAVATPHSLTMVVPGRSESGEVTCLHVTMQSGNLAEVAPQFRELMEGLAHHPHCRLGRTTLLARPAEIDERGAENQLAVGVMGIAADPINPTAARLRAQELINGGHVRRLHLDLKAMTTFDPHHPGDAQTLAFLRQMKSGTDNHMLTVEALELHQEAEVNARLPAVALAAPAGGGAAGGGAAGAAPLQAAIQTRRAQSLHQLRQHITDDNEDPATPSLVELAELMLARAGEVWAFETSSAPRAARYLPSALLRRVQYVNDHYRTGEDWQGTLVLADVRHFLPCAEDEPDYPRLGMRYAGPNTQFDTRMLGFLWADMSAT